MKKLILLLSVCFAFGNIVLKAQVVTSAGQMSVPRWNHQSQLLNNGQVLTFGGDDGNYSTEITYSSAELYNNGIWTVTGSMHLPRTSFASALLSNGKVLAIGGETADGSMDYASCELYDPSTSTWSYTDSLKTGVNAEQAAVVLNNGKVLTAGGFGDTAELYDPTLGTWSKTGVMTSSHGSFMTMVVLQSGKVLAVGGDGCINCGEVYDPATGLWTATANPTFFPREFSGGTLLKSGNVLISGSTTLSDGQLTSELYNPATNQFDSSVGRIAENVGSCPTVLLDNGNALVWGIGDFFNPTDTKVVQVYNAAADTWFYLSTDFIGSQSYSIIKLSNNQVLIIGGSFTTLNGATGTAWLINGNAIPAAATGINNVDGNSGFAISPNPGADYFTVTTQQPGAVSRVDIYDMEGRLLKQVSPQFNEPVMVTDLAPGMYLLRFYNRGGVPSAYQKWVKQ